MDADDGMSVFVKYTRVKLRNPEWSGNVYIHTPSIITIFYPNNNPKGLYIG